ncbi:hypothetical protein J5N97_002826 [Dioscorea zingiberensis]|uniref:AT hook motif-containing protein n=1 Tax=Dioscorea zingiberensis TaxID=325984 RepID=A0A9D5D2W9_9LILI|nr:hypothetical protein J5N97_002826 [Dioscorea zingiberensis]
MVPMNEESNTVSPENQPVKRKRGRPRKSESSGFEQLNKVQSVMINPASSSTDALVGQPVSGYLDGSFDSGYLLTVRVGESGPVFKGMVFVPGQSVPVTAENDIAPHLPMQKRVDVATQMAGEQNQPAASAPIHCRPSNAQTTDSTSLSAPVIHVPEDLSNKVPITLVQASEGISNDMNPCTQNMADALQSNLLKPGNMETTIAEINAEPSSQVAVEPNQSEKNLQSIIPQVPSGAYEEPLSVTTLGSEAQVGEAVQAPSGVEVGMVDGATGALNSGTSDSNVVGKETESEVQDSLGLGAQLQINALPEDRLEELKDGMDQPTNTAPPTSEAMTSQVEFEIKEACNNPEVGKNNQSSSDAPQTD